MQVETKVGATSRKRSKPNKQMRLLDLEKSVTEHAWAGSLPVLPRTAHPCNTGSFSAWNSQKYTSECKKKIIKHFTFNCSPSLMLFCLSSKGVGFQLIKGYH